MINRYLNNALSSLNELINITQDDITNIQNANHNKLEHSYKLKIKLIKEFESTKNILDQELVKLANQNSSSDLSGILQDDTKTKLDELREALVVLQKKNKEYAKYVIAVKEFYDSLLKELFCKNSISSYDTDNIIDPEQLFTLRV